MTRVAAYAKVNLALVVGPLRADGKHDVATVFQEIDLHDDVELEPAAELVVEGFAEDTLVRAALERIASAAGVEPAWRACIEKRIPVTSGLGGGSSDAAAALRLANAKVLEPLDDARLHELAAELGADVPFFLYGGAQLGTGDGTDLTPLTLPTDYVVLVVLPEGDTKDSTACVYQAFDERAGARGFEERKAQLLAVLDGSPDVATFPPNDLGSSPLAEELTRLGAFRADVTGAGPAVYGLFDDEPEAHRAAASLRRVGPTWVARPLAGADEHRR